MGATHRLPTVLAERGRATPLSYATAALLVALTIGIAVVFRRLPHANLPLLFLMVVLLIAARWGLWPSIFASVLSFLALNFLFTQPYYTLAVEEEGDIATLLFFLAMAALTGNLAARMRTEMANNRAALERVSALLDFSRRMAAASGAREALQALAERLAAACGARAEVLRPDGQGRPVQEAQAGIAGRSSGTNFERERCPADMAAAGRPPRAPGWTVLPLVSAGQTLGWAALERPKLDPDQRALAEGLCDQASVAVERADLVDSLRTAQVVSETERLRSALLSSVSHDLRTPLVSIIGAATSLVEYRAALKPDDRRELLHTVVDEAERLNRYIQNLLDMTRFGQQPFELRRDWVDLNDLISSAMERLGSALTHVRLDIRVQPEVALLHVHGALIEQVLVNVLDNAAGFAPDGSTIDVSAGVLGSRIVIEITDAGPGIPDDDRERIFDMFYRAEQGDRRQRPGTGLGLAICRSIVSAHSGNIEARSGAGGVGAQLRIILPVDENPIETVSYDDDPDHRGRRTDQKVSADQSRGE